MTTKKKASKKLVPALPSSRHRPSILFPQIRPPLPLHPLLLPLLLLLLLPFVSPVSGGDRFLYRSIDDAADAAPATPLSLNFEFRRHRRHRRAEPFDGTEKILQEENERAAAEIDAGERRMAPGMRAEAAPEPRIQTTPASPRKYEDVGPRPKLPLEEEVERKQIFEEENEDDNNNNNKNHAAVNEAASPVDSLLGDSAVNSNMSGDANATSGGNETVVIDKHDYYKTRVIRAPLSAGYWVDLDNYEFEGRVKTHTLLSNSHRRAATLQLSFDFRFYGHKIRNITIATGGFLYTGTFLHNWLAATQYIAPLMANFDTSQSPDALIRYFDNGTHFTVEWRDVRLQEEKLPKDSPTEPSVNASSSSSSSSTSSPASSALPPSVSPENEEDDEELREKPSRFQKPFNFQVTLVKGGDIIFAYKDVPQSVKKISTSRHPVKVGLSDAYIIESIIFMNIRRRTVYEYHRVDIPETWVQGHSAVLMKALTTCNQQTSCNQCLAARQSTSFDCQWCQAARRCSDGLDRHRQDWLARGCQGEGTIDSSEKCKPITSPKAPVTPIGTVVSSSQTDGGDESSNSDRRSLLHRIGVGGVVVVVLVVLLLVSVVAAGVAWAYCHPNSTAGLWLIEHRPRRLKTKMLFWKHNGAEELDDMEASPTRGDGYGVAVAT